MTKFCSCTDSKYLQATYPFPKQALVFTCLKYKSFENTVGKGEIAFPTVFSTPLENLLPFSSSLKLLSAKSLNLEESKTCRLGKGYQN